MHLIISGITGLWKGEEKYRQKMSRWSTERRLDALAEKVFGPRRVEGSGM